MGVSGSSGSGELHQKTGATRENKKDRERMPQRMLRGMGCCGY